MRAPPRGLLQRLHRPATPGKTVQMSVPVECWRGAEERLEVRSMADLVIRGAALCDGTGRAAAPGDLAVAGDRIIAFGRVPERGTREVDGTGLVLAPGFIDLHTHYDCQLFWDPFATPSPWHGVTTVVTGNCGFTIAPCRSADRETLMQLLLFVEGMPLETLRAGIRWTTSLSPTHFFGDGTPAPSRLADAEELLELAAALRPLERGVIEVAPRSTIGPPGDKLEEQRFFARLAEASGKLVSWAPLLDNPFAPGSAAQLLAEAAALQAAGRTVVPQVGCRPLEVRFDFAEPAFYLENNPVWRPLMAKPRDERRRLFTDPGFRGELARRSFVAGLAPSWDRLVCRMPQSVGTRPWQDRSVAEIAAVRGVAAVDAFCDLVLEDDLRAQWGVVLMNHDETAVAALLRHPAGLLALSDAGAHVDTPCDQGFTTYLLGHWVRELGALGLAEAVRLLTSVPAERYGIRGRGRLAPGYAADLVLFDPARVATRPTEMVYDLPRGQRRLLQGADGVEWVFVNGVPVVERGVQAGRRPGRVLRGGG